MSQFFAFLGRHARWVLPGGLLAGLLLPWAAEPLRQGIPGFIALLLFLAVLRILPDAAAAASLRSRVAWIGTLLRVLLAQLALPIVVFFILSLSGVPRLWVLAATLVAAAPPISGSPNLVLLLRGDAALAMRWLMLGTVVLPLSSLPVLYLLHPGQSATTMLAPALVLLVMIGSSVLLASVIIRQVRRGRIHLNHEVLDGISALTLALMVIGLMSALHAPANDWLDIAQMLLLAVAINVGFQCLGVAGASAMRQTAARKIGTGVVYGNRNIALFLAALPAAQMEPLLLFIACYQVPMYLTPLIGDLFYRRLE
ncbi:hypothetical protein [Granulosicoccus antarcticus]|uniref:Pantothenates transporter PanS n=1 Tax=Granulosicoccus antarcticus IMCC3135 TaxID=1192854 RepID=A0A2Z2NTY1_9GAMM|nr:hypothetical protein [Granulosicoccus antarcticus]ASJ72220.1 hypothetical protein IMCC3135_10630 [Granulosicoccus antarcticus IMCC3135]